MTEQQVLTYVAQRTIMKRLTNGDESTLLLEYNPKLQAINEINTVSRGSLFNSKKAKSAVQ